MKLYDLSNQYQSLFECLDDLPEDAVNDTLEALEGDINEKLVNASALILNLEAEANAIKQAINKMELREHNLNKKACNIRKYITLYMENLGIKEIRSDQFKASLRTNMPSLIVDDESKIPAKYIKEKIVKSVDKIGIKIVLAIGDTVEGCHLEQSKSLIYK